MTGTVDSDSGIPSHLYHYTGHEAFKGIVGNKEFWATQIEYMNDSMEVRHAVDLAIAYIDSGLSEEKWIKNIIIDLLRGLPHPGIASHVVSFSEHEDSLSQWRAYCANGGVSIEFSYEKLKQTLGSPRNTRFKLVKCIYDEEHQKQLVENACQEFFKELPSIVKGKSQEQSRHIIAQLVDESFCIPFMQVASRLKHKSFDVEAEWRLVGQLYRNEDLGWRVSRDMLIPYYRYNLCGVQKLITSIWSGPATYPAQAKRAIALFSSQHQLGAHIKATETTARVI